MKKRDVKKYIGEICNKAWGFPQEQSFNSMTTSTKIFFRPNNYRRQVKVKDCKHFKKGTIRGGKLSAHTKILTIKSYSENITLQLGRYYCTAMYSQPIVDGVKTVYMIERDTVHEIEQRVTEIKDNIQHRLDKALKKFTRKHKINIPYEKPRWTRYEDFIKGEEYIDSIPRSTIIHDTIFKKVYDKGIEFIDKKVEPTARLKTYIKNQSLKAHSPEIVKELDKIYNSIDSLKIQDFDWLKENINSLNEGIRHKESIERLEPDEKYKLIELFLLKKRIFG